jgi:hypothetical protein
MDPHHVVTRSHSLQTTSVPLTTVILSVLRQQPDMCSGLPGAQDNGGDQGEVDLGNPPSKVIHTIRV